MEVVCRRGAGGDDRGADHPGAVRLHSWRLAGRNGQSDEIISLQWQLTAATGSACTSNFGVENVSFY